ncbi:MAG TPA: hypothetical protein VML54_16305 [Candidatus Limnocylindrales bacterium]|nr:hypothetical protein [Candidatus Limnocylindrales bacterium]
MKENRLRGLMLALASSLAFAVPAGVAAAQSGPEAEPQPDPMETEPAPAAPAVDHARVRALRTQIRAHRANAWHWQRVMGKHRTPTNYAERRITSPAHLTWIRNLWRARAAKVRRTARAIPNRGAWLCIKRYEGPWNDPHAPYYGGLQMDMTFQRTYGRYLLRRKGTANRWKPLEQMWTAEKARRSGRGFHPWPNTARRCGLI